MSLTPRPTRSRYNSPFATVPANVSTESAKSRPDNGEKPKTGLDKWLEPPLPAPKPSFAEAGIERHGVVANMAALGALPSAKVIKAATRPDLMEAGGRGKKSGPSSVSTPSESAVIASTTPEPTANPPRRPSNAEAVETIPPPAATPTATPTAAPQTPQQQTSPQRPIPRPSATPQSYGQSVFSVQSPTAPVMPQRAPQPVRPPPQIGPDGEYAIDLRRTDRVVESAVQQALDEKRWPTAYALRTIYDDHRLNPRMVRLIDAICFGHASETERSQFGEVMKFKKKEGKRDRLGEYYFNGDGSDPAPQAQPSNAQTSSYSTPSATGARSMSDAQARRSSINQSMSASPQKEHESSGHIAKKHKSNDFQPPSNLEVNGNASANGTMKPQPASAQENGTSNVTGRSRSNSISSSSSLSSLDEDILRTGNVPSPAHKKDASHQSGVLGGAAHTQPSPRFGHANANTSSLAAETHPSMRNQSQPITGSHKLGPKTYTFSTVTTSSSSSPAAGALPSNTNNPANANSNHQRRPSSSTNSSMAPAALLPSSSFTSTQLESSSQPSFKAKKDLKRVTGDPYDENDGSSRLKRKLREQAKANAGPVVESFERHQIPLLREFESASDGDSVAAEAPAPKRTAIRLLNNNKKTRQSQATNYDSDSLSSPTLLSFNPDIAPGSLSVSRAGTPSAFNRPTRKPKTGTGLRVKTSPMKKKGGTLAGIPRASGERNSPTGNGAFSSNQDDNDDYCSSCGGNGDLVCCDGCTRSFHFKCVDPPMNEGALPDEWFCNVCLSNRNPRREERNGCFGPLLDSLERKNPVAFHLPKEIRDYFENVKTGTEGEYEEGIPPKTKQRSGYDEQPDYFKLKDNKGKTILCHQCHGAASSPDRAIIPCTYCGLSWHLDCLDPPMAKEPAPAKPWRCPAHVDDLLATIPDMLWPAHRFRKIKGASVIKPAVSRGVKNNGHIEIENDPTDDEEELGFYEQREYGQVYKLPEESIKLDFISQVRRKTGGGYAPRDVQPRVKPPPPTMPLDQRTIADQQAVLNLVALGVPPPEVGDATALINALITEAPPAVRDMIALGDADNIAKNNVSSRTDQQSLNALLAYFDNASKVVKKKLATLPESFGDREKGAEKAGKEIGDKDVEMSG